MSARVLQARGDVPAHLRDGHAPEPHLDGHWIGIVMLPKQKPVTITTIDAGEPQ